LPKGQKARLKAYEHWRTCPQKRHAALSDRSTDNTSCYMLQRPATSNRVAEVLSPSGPEGARWKPITPRHGTFGYASFYHADELAALPVRAVTRIKDNKSDPNLETGTYGLFSTCQKQMRSGIIKHGASFIFFFTRPRGQERHLAGMYELGAWTQGGLGTAAHDFAIAAKSVHFISPIPIADLSGGLAAPLGRRWRLTKRLSIEQTASLAEIVRQQPNLTDQYLLEVDRLERLNKFNSGYRYPTWLREHPWTWSDASMYLRQVPDDPGSEPVPNSSTTGWWGCNRCDAAIENGALLKACPRCRELGTLRPLTAIQVSKVVGDI
jgi:hypothetical protein